MADTQRDLAALQALLADNTSGDISPQDVRDFLVTVFGCYGEMQVTDGSTAQSSLSSTPAKMTGFDTDGVSNGITPDSTTDNDLNVPLAGKYRIYFHHSFTPDASEDYTFEVYKNGAVTAIKCYIEANATPDDVHVSMEGILTLAASDLLTIYVSTTGGAASMTPTQAQFGAHLIG
jgi:hypothetical protein